jgi:hypothetical protein
MSRRCPSCRAPLFPGFRSCLACGRSAMVLRPAGSQPQPGLPQPVFAQASTPPPSSPPPPTGATTATTPPSRGPGLKIIGGCAAAGCLTMLLASVAAAAWFFMQPQPRPVPNGPPNRPPIQPIQPIQPNGPGPNGPVVPNGPGPNGPGPTIPNGPGPDVPNGPGPDVPNGPGPDVPNGPGPDRPPTGPIDPNSPLARLVQQQVGPYTLQNGRRADELISKGAVDAVLLLYASGDGAQIEHLLSVWPSKENAANVLQGTAQRMQQQGLLSLVHQEEVKNQQGEVLGQLLVFQGPSGETALWSNGQLVCLAGGAQGRVPEFYKGLRY